MADDRPDPVPRIQKVVPLEGKRLWLTLNTGSELLLNMSNRLNTTRFYPLNDDRVFCSVSTDGFSLHFCVEDNYALDFTLREAIRMSVSSPNSPCYGAESGEL